MGSGISKPLWFDWSMHRTCLLKTNVHEQVLRELVDYVFDSFTGAGRVTFSSRVSFMSAVSCRFLQVTYGDIDKKVRQPLRDFKYQQSRELLLKLCFFFSYIKGSYTKCFL